jgi:hypothetical protein
VLVVVIGDGRVDVVSPAEAERRIVERIADARQQLAVT